MDPNIYPYMQQTRPKKRRVRPLAIVLCVVLAAVLAAGGTALYMVLDVPYAAYNAGSRAVVLDTQWSDFFRYPCNVQEEKAHIEQMLDRVQALGGDTVLWSARTGNGYACFRDPTDTLETSPSITENDRWFEFLNPFDPLEYLVERANEKGVAVVLIGTDEEGAAVEFDRLEEDCAEAIVRQSRRLDLQVAGLAAEGETGDYLTSGQVERWNIRNALDKSTSTADVMASLLRCDGKPDLLAAAVQYSDTGRLVLGTYSALEADESSIEVLNTWLDGSEAPDLTALWDGRSIRQELALAYPIDPAEPVTTNNIFIMGTSDPSLPLTVAGGSIAGTQTLERYGSKGVWGTVVALAEGQNQFTIAQEGGSTLQVVLTYAPPAGGSGTQPQSDGSVKAQPGQYLQVTSTAASALREPWDDNTISQTVYQGAVAQVMESLSLQRSGQYTYAYKIPSGDWILAKDCQLLEMIPEEQPESEEDEADGEEKAEDADAAADEGLETGETKEPDEEDEEEVRLISSVTDAEFTGMQLRYDESINCTVVELEGQGTPVIYHAWNEDLLSLVFYSARYTGAEPAGDDFVRSIGIAELENGFALNMTCGEGELWGWNSEYTEDGRTRIYLKHTPTLSTAESGPLTGVRVLLDAGHGGDEKGAMGAAGLSAPLEKDVNLAQTLAAKYRLEQLGATVLLTREDDSTLSLQERLTMLNDLRPDFFIALHHNSTALVSDVNRNSGTECYWFYTEGAALANALTANVTELTGRPLRGVFYDYYYVTRSNICPAVLLESGFMTNPGEYEDVSDPVTLLAEGGAVARAVLTCVEQGYVPYQAG